MFKEAITRLSESQARVMNAQTTVTAQQTAMQEDIRLLTEHLNTIDSKFEQTLRSAKLNQ